jgi:sec-independent protein translocase protein TatC
MATKLNNAPEDTNLNPSGEPEGAQMSLLEHLEELRMRLFRVVLSIGIGMAISVFFTNPVLSYLKESNNGNKFLLLDPTDSVVIFFRVSLLLGAILASPMVTYQIFMFVLPGLTNKEKRWVLMALPFTTILFLFGVWFTWYFLVPAYINFLTGFQSDIFLANYTADNYIGFVTAVLFWHGAAFETPVVFYVLGRLGAVTARKMIRFWRQALVGAALIAAFITPTVDPVTMLVITGILVTLYGLSIVLVALTSGFGKRSSV